MRLPRAQILFVGVRPREIEIRLIGVDLGEEIAAASEIFQIKKFIFFEAMHRFHIALDPSKAVIADAKVAAISLDTDVRYEGVTNESGESA
jgi:hypothetical protein